MTAQVFCFLFLLVKDAVTTEAVGPRTAEVELLSLVEKVAATAAVLTTARREFCYLLVGGRLSSFTAAVLSTAEEWLVQPCFLSKAWLTDLVSDLFLVTLGVTVTDTEEREAVGTKLLHFFFSRGSHN